jgi:hypothetical protein
MLIRIASLVLSLAGLLALILGLLFWFDIAGEFISLHMLLGLLAVAALWVIGVAQGLAGGPGSWTFALAAIIVGAVTMLLGLVQSSLLVGALHWIIRVIHLILGLLTIGIGHMGAARARKTSSP